MKIRRTFAMVLVQDLERALRFYRDALGFTPEYEEEDWAVFAEGVGLMVSPEPLPADNLNLNAVVITVTVPDVHAAYGELVKKGVAFLVPPSDVGAGVIATLRDSEGNLLQLLEHPGIPEDPE